MIKLISINIEREKHHDTVMPFLKKENPDVICFQEIYEEDFEMYKVALSMKGMFKGMGLFPYINPEGEEVPRMLGIAMLTKNNPSFNSEYYVGNENMIPLWQQSLDLRVAPHVSNLVTVWAEFVIEEKIYRIATTHLSVTHEGESSLYQKKEAEAFLKVMSKFDEVIFCGDFNAPRGKETFSMLSEKYTDNIPLNYTSSIDPHLHRVAGIEYVVDGLFSTDSYKVTNVKLVEGISDHKAIIANIK